MFHCMRIIIHILLLPGILRDKDKLKLCLVTNVLCLPTRLRNHLISVFLASGALVWPWLGDSSSLTKPQRCRSHWTFLWMVTPQFSCGLFHLNLCPLPSQTPAPSLFLTIMLPAMYLSNWHSFTSDNLKLHWSLWGHFKMEKLFIWETPTSKTNKSPTFHKSAFFHW